MKNSLSLLLLFAIALLFTACEEDNMMENPTDDVFSFGSGAYVSNQGPFGSGTGTITYISTDTVIADAYSTANGGEVLGNIVQSFAVVDTVAFITVNNGGKVVAASANSLAKMYEIPAIQPRYVTAIDASTAAISYWGADGFSGGVLIVNIHSGEVLNDINLGGAPERMAVQDDELYVAMSRGFQRDNRMITLSLSDYSITATTTVGDHPHTFITDRENQLWLVCGGHTDFNDATNNTPGALIQVGGTVARGLPTGVEQAAVSADGNNAYLLTGAGLELMSLYDAYNENVIIPGNYFALAVEPISGNIYLANAGDFTSPGEVTIYDVDQNEISTTTVGVIPGDIYLK
jgi:hypothetical protein